MNLNPKDRKGSLREAPPQAVDGHAGRTRLAAGVRPFHHLRREQGGELDKNVANPVTADFDTKSIEVSELCQEVSLELWANVLVVQTPPD